MITTEDTIVQCQQLRTDFCATVCKWLSGLNNIEDNGRYRFIVNAVDAKRLLESAPTDSEFSMYVYVTDPRDGGSTDFPIFIPRHEMVLALLNGSRNKPDMCYLINMTCSWRYSVGKPVMTFWVHSR